RRRRGARRPGRGGVRRPGRAGRDPGGARPGRGAAAHRGSARNRARRVARRRRAPAAARRRCLAGRDRAPRSGRASPVRHRRPRCGTISPVTLLYDCADRDIRDDAIDTAARAVQSGQLVVLPTDTVYGIGADAFDATAVTDLLAAKGRGRDMPVPVLVGSWDPIEALVSY